MNELTWVSILPPVVAIILAIWSRQVYFSLFTGILLGWIILDKGNLLSGFLHSFRGVINVFKSTGNTEIILFCGLVGSLIAFIRKSRGVEGFINLLSQRGWIKSQRDVMLFSAFTGTGIFIETSVSSLIVGAVFRPLYDKKKIPREKLAYICDSTSAPVNLLIPFNAWGALIIGLLAKEGVEQPVKVLLSVLPLNFYAFFTLILVFFIICTGKDYGPMSRAKPFIEGSVKKVIKDKISAKPPQILAKAKNMLVPVLIMLVLMPVFLIITGKGNLINGVGSTSVFWSVIISLVFSSVFYRVNKLFSWFEIITLIVKGFLKMTPVMVLVILAFAIGDVTRELQTGVYISEVAKKFFSPGVVPLILFFVSAFVAFSTGTSWGTYGILIPIAVSVAQSMHISLPLILSAVLGGGLFGDHASPISDTTIIASLAASCNHIDHVRTQLPYALTTAGLAAAFYFFGGIL